MLTQDQKTIIINDNVVIRIPGQTPEVAHKSIIRVISAAENSADSSSFWTGNQGENIKGISSQLHAQSIDIALQTFAAAKSTESKPFQTVRYKEGLSDKVERAQVIHKDCDRMLIKNLRGVFISAPVVKSPENACEPVTEI
jgi:phage gp45-like